MAGATVRDATAHAHSVEAPWIPACTEIPPATSALVDSRLRGNDDSSVNSVIPAKAGIHRLSPTTHGPAPDASIAGVLAVSPAKAGVQ